MKRNNIILYITIFIIGFILCNPFTCYAWDVLNTSVSNVVVRDERLESFDFQFEVPSSGFAETKSWLGIQEVKFNNNDLTDLGSVADLNYTSVDNLRADDDFLYLYRIKQFSKNSFKCFGDYSNINETISDLSITNDTNATYYVYLWTLYDGVFYPDALLATVQFNNGTVRIIDQEENEIMNDTFENLEADVVDKIEIVDMNLKLKVGSRPIFTAKIKNNSNKFDFEETFMSLNRMSTFSKIDAYNNNDDDGLVKDFIYYHISEIYVKDNVNLKFDENTEVYINGVKQKHENMYISTERLSIADESAVIIPEGYIAPSYLDEDFEDEQKSAVQNIIIQAMRAGKVIYSSDSSTNIITDALENGGDIELDLYVSESITKSISSYFHDASELNAINNKIGNDYKFAAYYDIIIEIYVNGNIAGYISELENPVEVTVPYPNGLPVLKSGYKRVWKFIRYHNGQIDEIEGEKTANGISFKNDKYSTFALVYNDIKIDDINNPGTNDNIVFWICMMIISIFTISFAAKKYKKIRY